MSVELLHGLVSIYSPSEQETEAVHFLVNWMSKNGFEQSYVDRAGNAVGVRGKADAPRLLILLGHIDTFTGEIPVRILGGALYGRGSVDAKGPLCAFAAAVARAEIPEGWRVMVVGAVEEECPTSKGALYICTNFTPDMCIIGEPSSSERITLGYKGRILVDYFYTRTVTHTALPEPTAGEMAFDFWQKVAAWCAEKNAGVAKYFDQVMPSLRAIHTDSDSFEETVKMTLGFRLPPSVSPTDLTAALMPLAPPGIFHTSGEETAIVSSKNTVLVRGLLAAIRARGKKPGFVYKTGTSDMNVVGAVWKCPIVAYGPGDSRLDHTPNEHLPLDEYEDAIETLAYFIEHLNDFG